MNAIAKASIGAAIMEKVLAEGRLEDLSPAERVSYYNAVCESRGLNPLTRPFEFVRLSGKLVMYARRDCADQLRRLDNVSVEVVSRTVEDGLCVVHVRAKTPDGRTDEDFGTVPLGNIQGEARANAILKAITKAKRRVTLSICGLGMMDETEVESVLSVPPARGATVDAEPPPAGSMREFAADMKKEPGWPLLAPDGRLVELRNGAWLRGVERAVAQMETPAALTEWRAAMGPHLASMAEAAEHEMVEAAERLIDARRDAFAAQETE